MLDEIVLEYVDCTENVNYYKLPMMFGVSLDYVLNLLNLKEIKTSANSLLIGFNDETPIYLYDKSAEVQYWSTYDDNGNLIENLTSKGDRECYVYDTYGRFCGIETDKKSVRWEYDRFGGKINMKTITDGG